MLTDLRVLVVDTGRVWWRLLPVIMAVHLLGWLGAELTLRVAVIAGDLSPWLTLILFAFHFVCMSSGPRSRIRRTGSPAGGDQVGLTSPSSSQAAGDPSWCGVAVVVTGLSVGSDRVRDRPLFPPAYDPLGLAARGRRASHEAWGVYGTIRTGLQPARLALQRL